MKLLPHQIEDAAFLASKKFAGNFSGMGSGKTLTALEALLNLGFNYSDGAGSSGTFQTIIIGPPISLHMWKVEYEQHTGGCAQIVKTGKQVLDPHDDAYIMSYEIATKRRDELKALGAKVLICDESHALKSPGAKRTHALIGADGLCESVDHTWLLTGTPSTRYNDDLFTFMARAANGSLKEKIGRIDLSRFRLRYCITQKKRFSPKQRFLTEVTVGNRNTEELNDMLFGGGMAVRRELADVWAQMPPLTINRLQVELDRSPELREMLKTLEGQTMTQIQRDMASNDEHLATIRRKLGVAKVKHSVKEIVSRIESGVRPILVGAWHTSVIDALVVALSAADIDVCVIDGRTPANKRQQFVDWFNNGSIDVMIGQISAMGVSLNMQGGSHIICVEEDFSPSTMSQFYARCHRIGQANHVHVDIFSSDTKLDEAIRRISQTKARGHRDLLEQED